MGAYQHMLELCPDLLEKAREYNYPCSSICILSGNELVLKQSFPATYNNLQSCIHNRDQRTPLMYGQDLAASWLFEDFLMRSLSDAGLTIKGAGADKSREVLPNTKVSASSDCIVSYNGKSRLLELMSDYTGYWKRTGRLELRDDKFRKMRDSFSLFLGVSTIDNRYIILNMGDKLDYTFIPAHIPYGGKPAYSICFQPSMLKAFDFNIVSNEIKEILSGIC